MKFQEPVLLLAQYENTINNNVVSFRFARSVVSIGYAAFSDDPIAEVFIPG
jgi:hypothetical protein